MISIIRATIAAVTDILGATKIFSGLGRVGETLVNRALIQHYGFASSPLPGAKGVCIAYGNQVIMVAEDDTRYRVALLPGEVALYDAYGNEIRLSDGEITINAAGALNINPLGNATIIAGGDVAVITDRDVSITAGGTISLEAESIELIGEVSVTGNLTATGTVHGSNV